MQYWAACHIDNRLYRFEALPCDCVAMGLDLIPDLDSSCSYFYRLPDSNGHFLARKKNRAPRAPVFRRNSDCWRFFFSVQQNRTGAISGIGLILPPPPKQNAPTIYSFSYALICAVGNFRGSGAHMGMQQFRRNRNPMRTIPHTRAALVISTNMRQTCRRGIRLPA